ncbi:uncharacterized protein HMPREF1120_02705 [Exophiala dermatitidis NIH/UT8656]|uniref:Uncharacterized protein n=1 Tax=Exophiala dermatitidis (strain ATCC 34100 / CBS 525.76 / NIH/UT8656) TaxID=858893 RepID=H6BQE4_EXODN|nr:uncharacterized protein HMPREF1120_02705 [Exophiala dermatitidis NIH/UT8656]EHY54537.1 hypothetical protein HMPREF1120_02705 [Exophiala dermatitidis NIH/UT8656]
MMVQSTSSPWLWLRASWMSHSKRHPRFPDRSPSGCIPQSPTEEERSGRMVPRYRGEMDLCSLYQAHLPSVNFTLALEVVAMMFPVNSGSHIETTPFPSLRSGTFRCHTIQMYIANISFAFTKRRLVAASSLTGN